MQFAARVMECAAGQTREFWPAHRFDVAVALLLAADSFSNSWSVLFRFYQLASDVGSRDSFSR